MGGKKLQQVTSCIDSVQLVHVDISPTNRSTVDQIMPQHHATFMLAAANKHQAVYCTIGRQLCLDPVASNLDAAPD